MLGRFRLTKEQLSRYFERICLPEAKRIFDVKSLADDSQLEYLNLLIKHQLVKVPWENLSQHYSWHRTVNVTPGFLFRKVTQNPGRGGYCFEVNYLFHVVLFTLQYDVYLAGSRVYVGPKEGYTGFEHIVSIVTIGQDRYLQDCGFGPQGPIGAMILESGTVCHHVTPAQSRLRYDHIPDNVTLQKLWILDHRYDEGDPYKPLYCFTDIEFTPTDILGLNLKPSTDRQSWFTHRVVAVRCTTVGESLDIYGSANETALEEEIDGAISIVNETLKWRRRGKIVVELSFKVEAERVEALQRYFGIALSEEDQQSIMGTAGMIASRGLGAA